MSGNLSESSRSRPNLAALLSDPKTARALATKAGVSDEDFQKACDPKTGLPPALYGNIWGVRAGLVSRDEIYPTIYFLGLGGECLTTLREARQSRSDFNSHSSDPDERDVLH